MFKGEPVSTETSNLRKRTSQALSKKHSLRCVQDGKQRLLVQADICEHIQNRFTQGSVDTHFWKDKRIAVSCL